MRMTVSSTTNKVSYIANGFTTVFAYPFLITASSQLKVYVDSIFKTETTDYTVGGATGGNVTFVAAPANGAKVFILRQLPLTKLVDSIANSAFPAETNKQALDLLIMIAQQLDEVIMRSLSFDKESTFNNSALPDPTPGTSLKFKADGSGFEWA